MSLTGRINTETYYKLKGQRTKVINKPCESCVTLAMCKNKPTIDVLNCPLLAHIFYDESLALPYNNVEGLYERSVIVKMECVDAVFWITRGSKNHATIDTINEADETLTFESKRIEFGYDYDELYI